MMKMMRKKIYKKALMVMDMVKEEGGGDHNFGGFGYWI